MGKSIFPYADAELVAWGRVFSAYVTANAASIGVDAAIAASLATAFSDFDAAWQIATDPATKTAGKIADKNAKRASFKQLARQAAALVHAHPGITAEELLDMGLSPRDTEPTPKPVPAFVPGMLLERVDGHTIHFRLQDTQEPDSRAKPVDVAGAAIYYHVGEDAPLAEQWKQAMNVTRTICTLTIPQEHPAGSKVWLTAAWFNPRMEMGPACVPQYVTLGGGTSLPLVG
jgi:hypothetical protein